MHSVSGDCVPVQCAAIYLSLLPLIHDGNPCVAAAVIAYLQVFFFSRSPIDLGCVILWFFQMRHLTQYHRLQHLFNGRRSLSHLAVRLSAPDLCLLSHPASR
ncbi:hypothetical protein BsWGS_19255 [Bradybaena similaris]